MIVLGGERWNPGERKGGNTPDHPAARSMFSEKTRALGLLNPELR